MKKILFLLPVLAVVIGFTGCTKSNNTTPTTANVMFVNGCAGTVSVNVSVNGTKLTSASTLNFLSNSGYQSITAGSDNFAFALAATGTPLISGTESITAGLDYSVFTGGLVTGTSTSFIFTSDDLSAPASGMAKVRFANFSSDSLNLSCYIGTGTTVIASNVSMGSVTPFYSIAATSGTSVLLQDPSKPTELSTLSNQNFTAGSIYTVMLTGTSTGTGSSVLTLTVINNK